MATKTSKKIKIDRENYLRLKEMLGSGNTENHVTAIAAIENCDIKESLVFVLTLYKLFKKTTVGWETVIKVVKKLGFDIEQTSHLDKMYGFLKAGNYTIEDRQVLMDEASGLFKVHLIELSNFNFLNDCELKLVLKK